MKPMSTTAPSQLSVDPETAREVAAAFVDAPNAPSHPSVMAAYAQLKFQSDRLFARLTNPDQGPGIRVEMTTNPDPYASDSDMIQAVRTSRVLEVTTAATDPYRQHPLLGCEVGGAYDRFRAVHDLIGHVGPALGFDRDGEYAAWLAQDRLFQGLARWALATELHAEHSVLWTTGILAEHKAILLETELLSRARRSGSRHQALTQDTKTNSDDPRH
jgi:hypothetical protein